MALGLGTIMAKGAARTVVCLTLANGTEPALQLIEADALDKDRKRLAFLFQLMADTGRIANAEHFKALVDRSGLFEFRGHQARVLCFMDAQRNVILADGEVKKRDKLNRGLLDRVAAWRVEYLGTFSGRSR